MPTNHGHKQSRPICNTFYTRERKVMDAGSKKEVLEKKQFQCGGVISRDGKCRRCNTSFTANTFIPGKGKGTGGKTM